VKSRSIDVGVPAQVVWDRLVAAGKRDWYYRLTPEGEFAGGARIEWNDITGKLTEESEVVEVDAPHRLVLRTRFLFAPAFAASEPHLLTWDIEPTPEGSRVRLGWQASDLIGGLFESEGDSILAGLRLALDPAAQADLARLPEIGEVEIHDVTPERVADYLSFFDHDAFRDFPSWQSCYCMETHSTYTDEESAARTAGQNRRDMSEMISRNQVTALLAYTDGKPVGWCNYGETTKLSNVMRRFGTDASGYEGVGSVACFVIAAPYRGHGIASRLLDAAVERLRSRGLRAVEGYPHRGADSAQTNYRGPLSMYLRAGFELYRETERNVIVRKTL
jgi:ribosomal protein S18 acetylase RimI-like enzyme